MDALDLVLRELAAAGSPKRIWDALQSLEVRSQIEAFLRAHPGLQALIYWTGAIAVGFIAVFYAEVLMTLAG